MMQCHARAHFMRREFMIHLLATTSQLHGAIDKPRLIFFRREGGGPQGAIVLAMKLGELLFRIDCLRPRNDACAAAPG
jgi:hypothetical protein